ncbi:MAG: hypothetical protein JXR63_10985, partial [Spirochaetales bacterium]|nr:hypothetical protein [Spirochaetales bacterium]
MFETLVAWVNSSIYLALIASFVWGVLSVVLSPCHLSSLPLMIGVISKKDISLKKSFFISLLFALGIVVSIFVIALITGLTGRIIGDVGNWVNLFLAIVFFFFGLVFVGLFNLNFLNKIRMPQVDYQKYGTLSAFLLGLVVGVGLGACTFAFMAPVLSVFIFQVNENLFKSILIVVMFALGHGGVIVLAGTAWKSVISYINWTNQSKFLVVAKAICGIILFVGAGYYV